MGVGMAYVSASLQFSISGIKLEWSNSGETLAVAGVADPEPGAATPTPGSYRNLAKFYTADTGSLRFVAPIPCAQKPVTALTWGMSS